MANAGVEPDSRGLMALGQARAIVRSTSVFEHNKRSSAAGRHFHDADLAWAALHSVQDADEFVRAAKRIQWHADVRGRYNLAAFERYGAGMLPWLDSRIDRRGVLINKPWCLLPCLLAIVDPRAFSVAVKIRAVGDENTAIPAESASKASVLHA